MAYIFELPLWCTVGSVTSDCNNLDLYSDTSCILLLSCLELCNDYQLFQTPLNRVRCVYVLLYTVGGRYTIVFCEITHTKEDKLIAYAPSQLRVVWLHMCSCSVTQPRTAMPVGIKPQILYNHTWDKGVSQVTISYYHTWDKGVSQVTIISNTSRVSSWCFPHRFYGLILRHAKHKIVF